MSNYSVEPVDPSSVNYVIQNVREADAEEIYASSMSSPKDAVLRAVLMSDEAWVGAADGVPFCVFGVGRETLLTDYATPWLVGTDNVPLHSRGFARKSSLIVPRWVAEYGLLFNFVDVRNELAIKWLKWLGFELGDPVPYGPLSLPFHPFRKGA